MLHGEPRRTPKMVDEHMRGGPAVFKKSLYDLAAEINMMEGAGMIDWEAWKAAKAEREKIYWETMDSYFQNIGNGV